MKLRTLILSLLLSCPVMLVAQGLDTAKIDEAMGRSGQKTGDVYRWAFPALICMSRLRVLRLSQDWHSAPGPRSLEATTTQWSWATWFSWRTNSRRS